MAPTTTSPASNNKNTTDKNVNNELVIVPLSEEERRAEKLTDETIFKAIEALHRDGIVALAGAVSIAHKDAVNTQMCADLEHLRQKNGLWHIQGEDTGNISLSPPLNNDLLFQDIYCNPYAVQVLKYVLGPEPELRFIRSNTCIRGTQRQQVHTDADFFFPAFAWGYAVNVPLVDFTVENGATELWLGTHRDTSLDDHIAPDMPYIKQELLDERAKVAPPIRATVPKGSIILRDLRLWHAGIPNHTDVPRVMLAEIFFARWYRNRLRVTLPESTGEVVRQWENELGVAIPARFVPDGFDYLSLNDVEAVAGSSDDYISPNVFPFEGTVKPLLEAQKKFFAAPPIVNGVH